VSPSPTTSPFAQPPAPGIGVPELILAVALALAGVWSLARWMRVEFLAESWRDRLLYLLHVSARVGLWFAFAAFFLGLALVDDPERFTWFLIIPLGLAGIQLVTGVALGQRGGGRTPRGLLR
jgi:hypothetical protein